MEEKKPNQTETKIPQSNAQKVARSSSLSVGMRKTTGFLATSWKKATYLYIFAAMFIAFVIVTPYFRWGSVANLFSQSSVLGVMALGMGIIIITGDIDLSVGSNFAFTGGLAILAYNQIATASPDKKGLAMLVAFLICLGVGAVIGFLNGLLVGKLKMPSFIATLGTMLIFRSLCKFILKSIPTSNGQQQQTYQIYDYSHSPFYSLGNNDLLGRNSNIILPITGFLLFLMVGIVFYLVTYTKPGRKIYAIGSNARGASLAGINVPWTRIAVFTIAGVLVGLSAFLHTSIYGSMDSSTAGQSYELYAIASCIIGGIAMSGGKGNTVGILFGTMSFQIIDKIISALQLNPLINDTIKGMILLIAVVLQLIQGGFVKNWIKMFQNRQKVPSTFAKPAQPKPGAEKPVDPNNPKK
ncbi:MAG: ABC transporter permease [Bacilli bacterium]|jgi:ribose transport system permease protein|nr:ABC transporter permease [Bacilli bacterium]